MASDRKLIEFWGKKRRNTSRIWDYFGFYEDDEKKIWKNEAICKICKVGLKYTGSTSNLLYHVSSRHQEKKFTGEGEHEPSKQTTLFAYQVKKPYSFESAQAQKLHLKVTLLNLSFYLKCFPIFIIRGRIPRRIIYMDYISGVSAPLSQSVELLVFLFCIFNYY